LANLTHDPSISAQLQARVLPKHVAFDLAIGAKAGENGQVEVIRVFAQDHSMGRDRNVAASKHGQ
jgi:hypothetical protein